MKTEQQQNARDLYLQTDKTQAEIAEILNVDRKTVYLWCKKGRWEEMKIAARQMPRAILHDIYNHIEQVNKRIREREDKCPKMKEIEKLRKLTNMTKQYVNKHIGSYIEVFEELTHFIAGRDYELCKKVTQYADQYVQGTFGDDENFYVDKRVAENVSTVITNLAKQKKADEQEGKTKQETDAPESSEPTATTSEAETATCPLPSENCPEVGQNGAFYQTQQNDDNPLTDNDSEADSDPAKCPIFDEKYKRKNKPFILSKQSV